MQRTSRTRVLFGTVLLAVAGYFAIFGGEYDVFDVRRVRQQHALELQRVEQTRADNERMRARRDSLTGDPATLERLARERYGLIRDGELLYRFTQPDDSAAAPAAPREPPR